MECCSGTKRWEGISTVNRMARYRETGLHQAAAKPEKVRPIQLFLKVAAPWGRGDLSRAASGYSISGFAIGLQGRVC